VVKEVEVVMEKEVPVEVEVVVEKVVEVEKEVEVEVVKEVEVEVIERVVVEVPKEVEVEKIVEVEKVVEVEKEVEVIKEVEVEVEKIVVATPSLPGGTLRVTSQASIGSLDQVWTTAYVTAAVAVHMHERLFEWDEDLFPKPQLVDTWDLSSDGLTYTFTLRDGVTFHDGSAVTSDDAIQSLMRQMEGPHFAPKVMVDFTEDPAFEKVDNQTFKLMLAEPFGQVIATFSAPWGGGPILPKSLAETPASEKLTTFTGTGAYKLEKWDVGNQIVLERYDDYRSRPEPGSYLAGGHAAYLDRIVWLEVPDEETKMAGLETGEWDVVDGASLDFFQRSRQNPDLTVRVYKPGHRSVLPINQIDPPFNNQKMRQALQAGLNIEAIMAAMGDPELVGLCPALFHCGTPLESNVGAELYNESDLEKAQRLMEEAGYAGETIIYLNPTDYATITPIGLATKPQLEQLGFTVDFPAYDWATLVTLLRDKENWSLFTSWIAHWSEGGDPLRVGFLFPEGGPANPQHSGYKDLILEYATAQDLAGKRAAIDKIQALWFEDVPMIYLGTWFSIFPSSKDVKNLNVVAFPYYANVWLDR
jgi:peptide/nickel transport system substrate-binding protein